LSRPGGPRGHDPACSSSPQTLVAFRAYSAALDREELTANRYAQLLGGTGDHANEPIALGAKRER
jgi:hypothetical protein